MLDTIRVGIRLAKITTFAKLARDGVASRRVVGEMYPGDGPNAFDIVGEAGRVLEERDYEVQAFEPSDRTGESTAPAEAGVGSVSTDALADG